MNAYIGNHITQKKRLFLYVHLTSTTLYVLSLSQSKRYLERTNLGVQYFLAFYPMTSMVSKLPSCIQFDFHRCDFLKISYGPGFKVSKNPSNIGLLGY